MRLFRSCAGVAAAPWIGRTLAFVLVILALAGAGIFAFGKLRNAKTALPNAPVSREAKTKGFYSPTAAQWATLTVVPVEQRDFQSEVVTEGKIAVNEDSSTPIFSPYAGRVTSLVAKPGDIVEKGQPLFVVESTDTVQALNDFIAAITAKNKAKSALNLAEMVEKRSRDLYAGKATPLKDLQNAQAGLVAAQNDIRSAESALDAGRTRLRILGRTDEEIATFQDTGKISPQTPIYAPIGGTIVQRKVGPGQYVSSATSDPVFVIGDLSTVWLTAYVRETATANVRLGQTINFTVMAFPERQFEAKMNYVAAALDPTTRRLLVRATIDNPQALFKPEMFASVSIVTSESGAVPAVSRDAVIYEGNSARAWVAHDYRSIELRKVKLGLISGNLIQVLEGLHAGEKVISKGVLFIDRAASNKPESENQ